MSKETIALPFEQSMQFMERQVNLGYNPILVEPPFTWVLVSPDRDQILEYRHGEFAVIGTPTPSIFHKELNIIQEAIKDDLVLYDFNLNIKLLGL